MIDREEQKKKQDALVWNMLGEAPLDSYRIPVALLSCRPEAYFTLLDSSLFKG